jgi:hypothetical protein
LACRNISLARSIHCCFNILFPFPDQRHYTVITICIYTHIWHRTDCIWITVATK